MRGAKPVWFGEEGKKEKQGTGSIYTCERDTSRVESEAAETVEIAARRGNLRTVDVPVS